MDNNFEKNGVTPENEAELPHTEEESTLTEEQDNLAEGNAVDEPISEVTVNEDAVSEAAEAKAPERDFSRYQTTGSTYASVPKETVYISSSTATPEPPKTEKPQRVRFGAGRAVALVLACAVLSGATAFGGTYLANSLNSNNPSNPSGGNVNSSPSVIVESIENPAKTPGTYDKVAEAVAPTVVEITTESIVTDNYMWGGSYVTGGAGSGVIISSDGLIVTNNHVVTGANTIKVTTKDGQSYPATVVGTDAETDIAVIKIAATDLPFALIGNSDELAVGQEVLAVGNPLGNLGGTVTNGIISALSREVDIDGVTMTLIQTNAEVNPGNSGGGLFNLYGELVGIVNAKSVTSSLGVSVEGIGFAIPVATATDVAAELANYGYVRGRVKIGINYVDVQDSWDAMRYRVSALGCYISASVHDELKPGDRIVAIDGKEVMYSPDIKAAIRGKVVGDEVVIKVVRDGKYVDITVTLIEYVPEGVTSKPSVDEETFENNFGG